MSLAVTILHTYGMFPMDKEATERLLANIASAKKSQSMKFVRYIYYVIKRYVIYS